MHMSWYFHNICVLCGSILNSNKTGIKSFFYYFKKGRADLLAFICIRFITWKLNVLCILKKT